MSLPSQQRRGAASGRASTRGIKKRRRNQGIPGPLKVGAAVVLLVIVLWTGWSVLGGPQSSQAEGSGLQQTSTKEPAEGTTPEKETSGGYVPGKDASLDAILGPSSKPRVAETPQRDTATPTPQVATNEPVKGSALPEPEVILNRPLLTEAAPTEPQSSAPANSNPAGSGTTTPPERVASTPTPPAGTSTTGSTPAAGSGTAASRAMLDADVLGSQGKLVEARSVLNSALLSSTTTESERAQIRQRMSSLNATLVFGPKVDPADPMTESYTVGSGDSLARIAARRELATHYKLIARVNGIKDPSKIRLGQKLKLVRGPFHAVVDKSDYRMDVYHGPPDSPRSWVYVTSFPVGLGSDDGTPTGSFTISSNKLENPGWVNPRDSSERYDRNDPKNPIGEFWLGLDGIGASAVHKSLGIHGTTEPESVGQSMSMGCVRLRDEDIAVVFELLEEHVSVVHIVD